ncbi:type VI-B CRISPR-associated RNA-guided ribonuclease Cas13b [Chryseobacterium sp. MMS23-Vi53]|uniref:type VI-B CRISPR-associated RNA-guided ribonuclease Cas13b n=1 Tax=Chryseobacterium sp. MMS23-Vi53 TaxID=3386644 RepID=UPI0039E85FC3
MNTQPAGLGISYSHTLKEDKHFFGGFLNLGINNLEVLIEAFKMKFFPGSPKTIDIKNFGLTCLKIDNSDHDFECRVEFLQNYLPVIRYLDKRNKEIFKKQVELLFGSLDSLRNFYTHYYHTPLSLPDELFDLLDTIFSKVASDVKENKVKDDKSRHLLKTALSEELDIRYKMQLERLKELKATGKKVNLHDHVAIKNGVLNSSFNHLIYKNEAGDTVVTRRYAAQYSENEPAENGITISQSGLLFLAGLFLKRKEVEDLKSRVKGFKAKIIKEGEENISGLKYMATHWIFSYLSFKQPKQTLTNDFDRETLLLQIIDELSKVPDDVYQAFNEETRNLFVEDINQYLKEGNDDYTLEEAQVIHQVIRKRYENKFNYFAIRYLDEFAGFTSLKFQVHLGNYIHDKRTKNISGTELHTERRIKERVKVFGRLSDAQRLKNDFFANESHQGQELGWEILPNPSYVFIENNIPIYFNVDNEVAKAVKLAKVNRKSVAPEERKVRSGDKAQKHIIVESISKRKLLRKDEPTALLSLNEIPALLYEILVKGTSPNEIEEILKSKAVERVQIIKNYNPEQPLPSSQISKRLISNSIAVGKKYNLNKIQQLLKNEIFLANEKLALIYKNRVELHKKIGGKNLRNYAFGFSELGREAAWIAKDIKRFMPLQARKEWKGYQHSQLQQSLSYYESRPDQALNILKDNWDFDDESILWNSWIKDSFKEKSFDRFYERYLHGKKEYLENFLENLQHFSPGSDKILKKFLSDQMPKNFFDKRLYILEPLEQEKDKILSYPLVFPRGLFDPAPTFVKGIRVTEEPERFAAWYRYGYSPDHAFQRFYEMERDYSDLINDDTQNRTDADKNKSDFTTEQQYSMIKNKQDLKIKNIKIQDLFLKLIAETLFRDVFDYVSEIRLSDLYLTQAERIEKEQNAAKQSLRPAGDDSENIINDNFIWSKTIPYEKDQIYEPAVKLKDIGKFKYFLKDARIARLLSYDISSRWSKSEIEKEIYIGSASYESIRREAIFKELQKLEEKILAEYKGEHPEELEQSNDPNKKGIPNFKKYIVNGILRKQPNTVSESDCFWLDNFKDSTFEKPEVFEILRDKNPLVQEAFLLVYLRNKFAHNQLPVKEAYFYINENYSELRGNTVAETLLNFVTYSINSLTK